MKTIALSILLTAGAALAGAASAQEAPTYIPSTPFTASEQVRSDPGIGLDYWRTIPGPALVDRMQAGVSALEADDFALAERIFASVLRGKPANADANFYMGVAKMNLGKWEEARTHLEIAVTKKPKHPDPKSRLGVTYAMLGDAAAADAQRASLMRMSDACKGGCRLSPYIVGGIQMIDEALAEPPAPNPAGQG